MAVVTGATGGIGFEIAKALLQAGFILHIRKMIRSTSIHCDESV